MGDYIGQRERGYIHIAEAPIEDVVAGYFHTRQTIGRYRYTVRQGSLRYKTFAKSTVCCCCGIVGTRMLLDTPKIGSGSAHYNLYAEWNGKLVLMTKDHIIPRSKGGPDTVDNMRTMCDTCNGHRGDLDISLDDLYELVIEKERERLARKDRVEQMLMAQHLKKSWL